MLHKMTKNSNLLQHKFQSFKITSRVTKVPTMPEKSAKWTEKFSQSTASHRSVGKVQFLDFSGFLSFFSLQAFFSEHSASFSETLFFACSVVLLLPEVGINYQRMSAQFPGKARY